MSERLIPTTPKLMHALRRLFSCPNWENRGPEWKDISEALKAVYEATMAQEAIEAAIEAL